MYYIITKLHTKASLRDNITAKTVARRLLCFLVVISSVVLLSACSADDLLDFAYEKLNDFNDYLSEFVEENVNCEYVVEYVFSNPSDAEKIEKRLNALEITVADKEKENGVYRYRLTSHYAADDEYFKIITKNYDTEILVGNKTDVIKKDDVIAVVCYGWRVQIEVSKTFADLFRDKYLSENIKCRCDDVELKAFAVDENKNGKEYVSLLLGYGQDKSDAAVKQQIYMFSAKIATMLSSDPLESTVETKIIKSATPYKPE